MSTQFNRQNHFYFKLFSLVKKVLIQFSISIDFVYTQLNVKTVLYLTIQFSVSTVSMSKTAPFQIIQFIQTVLIQKIQFSISMQLVLFNP